MAVLKLLPLIVTSVLCVSVDVCPKQCDCDMDDGLYRAECIDQNIVTIEIGVPKQVEVYSLSHNGITELDNYCFKDAGYSSIRSLTLSYNLIFWIGLHAFSGLYELTYLDLSNNRLMYIPSDLFWDTPKLESLDLSGNMFEFNKNEPFIMHQKLQVLNLNNCRIKAMPDRLLTRLPNLRKLDLSDNYMITLSSDVLSSMRKLERIELRNEYWKCNQQFLDLENWITGRGIQYEKQCNRSPNMMERMISVAEQSEREDIDINKVWNMTKNISVSKKPKEKLSGFKKLDEEFSSFQAFIIGVEVGLGVGIVGTYIWLRSLCKCGHLRWKRPQTRRERRRAPRLADDLRANLLWTTIINPDLETPPSYRRELSLPDRSPPFPVYGVVGLNDTDSRDDRAETPPPPYHDYSNIDIREPRT